MGQGLIYASEEVRMLRDSTMPVLICLAFGVTTRSDNEVSTASREGIGGPDATA